MGEEGHEKTHDSQGKSTNQQKVAPFVVPFQGISQPSEAQSQLNQLAQIWPDLQPEVRARILKIATEHQQ
jgi:hypothetical protein